MSEGRNILVVEDEYFLASDLARLLGERGIHVVGPVASLTEAARIAESGGIDCAILDINLRGQTVFPVADRLRAADIPFLFATGYGRAAIPDRFADIPHLEKPYGAERVLPLVAAAMQSAAAPCDGVS